MSKRSRVRQRVEDQAPATELSVLMKRLIQLESDQKADEARIDAAIRKAESEITALGQRQLVPEALWNALWAIRDKTVLMTRDVRRNMHRRTIAAKQLQKSLPPGFLCQSTRFAAEDVLDAALRTQFFNLLQRTPTAALLDHLKDAIETGNSACAESIRFEFRCRADRHLYSASFEVIEAPFRDEDPTGVEIRLTTIANAAATVDKKVTDLLQRVSS
jgi:hypothetical protein